MYDGYYVGKVALVTGSATGMGRTTAIEFARAGAKVVVADWNETAGQATADEIVKAGGDAAACEQRFKTYDPATGTFLGEDGKRHPC